MSGAGPVVAATGIPGLLVVGLPVHTDARGWFKENWHREGMTAVGLPDFGPVQHSVAHNEAAGVTRGIHAEPWDKLVSVVSGRAFGAWVDLRAGPTFGAVHTQVLDPATAVFVPRGVGNAYQTLTEGVVYSYLVNDHWSPAASYPMLNLADPAVAIPWPIPLEQAVVSEKDRDHPSLAQVVPVPPPPTWVLGAGGQVGTALLAALPDARPLGRDQLDLADPAAVQAFDFGSGSVVLNAAAYTAVDAAETPQGRAAAWALNAAGVAALARAASTQRATLVHYSTDYVFDGTGGTGPGRAYTESDPVAPLSAYGASKAAGEQALAGLGRHYLIRTSWVIGAGRNFVATMADLARRGAHPRVVNDQSGRLTLADDLAAATRHLLTSRASYGTYHVTNTGPPATWAEIARRVFTSCGRDPRDVTETSTQDYYRDATGPVAPRPPHSTLHTAKLEATGFTMPDQWEALTRWEGRGQSVP